MLKLAGYLLIFTSILHFIGGFVFYSEPLAEIAQAGWWNAVSPDPFNLNYEREAAFWFMMISPLLFALGILCCWIEEQKLIMPAFIGWILLIVTIIGIVILPVSGIWLLLAPSGIILFISMQNKDSNIYQSEK
ncbi:MAG: DUF6463 family protein [Pleurocapsa sp. MO_226.B13]|nr:DUF6463 family protein [Pleurocapsa sp. MO_226.B13]